ncbi:ABC transporter permease [Roseomonas sp. CCTCC AB2023176]|uniref:ABC transporter permease n=1 Tax=Roseomonas sp. CCTCC AB2023176 TaxID=3342640 RepID=UPI0035D856DE
MSDVALNTAPTPQPDRPAIAPPVSRHDVAGQWTLIWWRFRKHKLAMVGLVVTVLIYVMAAAPGFFAINDPAQQAARQVYHPPHPIHFFDDGAFRLHFNPMRLTRDRVTLEPLFTPDTSRKIPIAFFVRGPDYELFGLFRTNIHLIGSGDPTVTFYPLGADRLGRCVWSRLAFGTQISMSIGLVGVTASLIIGIILGGISGYYGGKVDFAIQRVIEFVLSLPTIPIWLAMAAALPQSWPPVATYFMITIILSLIGWAQLARVVRGRFLSLRTEDFVMAARLDGASEKRIIFRHMLPSFTSHIVASITLAIPAMILAETALSFLGLGLQPPVVSWGVLLREAQNIRSIASAPWLFAPGVAVVISVLALNFLGDGLRDASDPYDR